MCVCVCLCVCVCVCVNRSEITSIISREELPLKLPLKFLCNFQRTIWAWTFWFQPQRICVGVPHGTHNQHHALHPTHRVLPCSAFRWSDLCI